MKNKKIQILRALAIIAVVIIHTYPLTSIGIYIRAIVNYAVALFIFCSGYLTKLEYDNWKQFYLRRLLRIGIPYLIWSFIYMSNTISTYSGVIHFMKNYIHIVLHGAANATMYFVIVYIGFVFTTPLISILAKSKWRSFGWLISPVYLILKTYIPKLTGVTVVSSDLFFLQFLGWFTFYYLGMLIGNQLIKYKKNSMFTLAVYLLTILISLGEGLAWNSIGDYNMATTQARLSCLLSSSYACLLSYCFLQSGFEVDNRIFNRLLIILGDYSFGIYLSHILIIRIFIRMGIYEHLIFPMNSILVLAGSLALLVMMDKVCQGKLNRIMGIR